MIRYESIGVKEVIRLAEILCEEGVDYDVERHDKFILIVHMLEEFPGYWEYFVCTEDTKLPTTRPERLNTIIDPTTGRLLPQHVRCIERKKVIWSPWVADMGIRQVPHREVPWTIELCFYYLKNVILKRLKGAITAYHSRYASRLLGS